MDLREMILREHSKENCNKIISWVGSDKKKFDQLFELFLNGGYRVTQRSAWPLSFCVIAHPSLIQSNFERLISNLWKPDLHDSIKRNTVRLLQYVDIPAGQEGAVMERCFDYVSSASEAVAIKAFSLTVLGRLAKKYPEIIPEIKLLIEDQIMQQTPAFKSRAKKILQEFNLL
ncbi:MAG: hypothetical protein M3Z92_01080 [Bacteroidota bacterium]|nr:hypothetical protein [Bacteroidota bacterium]